MSNIVLAGLKCRERFRISHDLHEHLNIESLSLRMLFCNICVRSFISGSIHPIISIVSVEPDLLVRQFVCCSYLGYSMLFWQYRLDTYYTAASRYGQGSGHIYIENLMCNGSENHIDNCSYNTENTCTHAEDVSVVCTGKKSPTFLRNYIYLLELYFT